MLEELHRAQPGLMEFLFFFFFLYYSVPGAELMLVVVIMLGPRSKWAVSTCL